MGGPGSIFPQAGFADPNDNPLHTPPPLPRTHQLPRAPATEGGSVLCVLPLLQGALSTVALEAQGSKADAPHWLSRCLGGAALNWGESGATRLVVITIQTKKKEQAFLLCYQPSANYYVQLKAMDLLGPE